MSYNAKVFETLTTNIYNLRTGTLKNALAFLEQRGLTFLQKQLKSSQVPLTSSEKRLFEQSYNLITSFIDGASTGDVDASDMKTLRDDLRLAEKAHEERMFKVKETEGRRSVQHTREFEFDPADPSNLPRHDDKKVNYNKKEEYDPGDGAQAVFDKYEKFRHKLDIVTKKQFVAQRMPIVVLNNGIPDLGKLRATGLCDDLLFGYPVLKNQVLIGLNPQFVQQYRPGWDKYQKEVKNNTGVSTKLDADWDKISDELSSGMKERFGRSFVMMGKAHTHGKLTWIWMAESRDLKRLNGTTGQATFTVTDWSLPFESEHLRKNPRVPK